jgi:integrase/recombinase XerD
LILDFLDHLETERGNSVRTRNARWAAIHSFMRYAAVRDPASLPITQRVLAIPAKRFNRPVLGYLSRDQIAAILGTPDKRTWNGRRDTVLFATATTPAPAYPNSPCCDVLTCYWIDTRGAAARQGTQATRHTALKTTAAELRAWLDMINSSPETPVFPNRTATPLTRSGIGGRLDRAVTVATQACPSLAASTSPSTH